MQHVEERDTNHPTHSAIPDSSQSLSLPAGVFRGAKDHEALNVDSSIDHR